MDDSDFSDAFCRFLQATIPSVEAAELLLALARSPQTWWEPGDAAKASGASLAPADAGKIAEHLAARGLLEAAPDKRVRFQPANEELAAFVQTLAQAYKERPVTLIRVIYALRDSKIQSFAEAFRIRNS
jgi:hypothetical protein